MFAHRPLLRLLFQRRGFIIRKRWVFPGKPANLKTQYGFFRRHFRGVILFQVGKYFELFDRDAIWSEKNLGMKRIPASFRFYARCGVYRARRQELIKRLTAARQNVLVVAQSDRPLGHMKNRMGVTFVFNLFDVSQ